MNDGLQSLALLLEHAQRQRDKALTAHHRAQAAAAAAAEQSNQLLGYRRDYQQRWHTKFQREGPMALVHCYHQFMDKLTQAVDHQARIAAHAGQQTEHTLAQVRELELRCASVRKLIERRSRELRLGTERREQKQTDEQAMRSAWASRSTDDHP